MIRALIIVQMVMSVLLVFAIMLQNKGTGLSEAIGGSSGGGAQMTRRGPEKFLFYATILISIAFFGISVALMFLA